MFKETMEQRLIEQVHRVLEMTLDVDVDSIVVSRLVEANKSFKYLIGICVML